MLNILKSIIYMAKIPKAWILSLYCCTMAMRFAKHLRVEWIPRMGECSFTENSIRVYDNYNDDVHNFQHFTAPFSYTHPTTLYAWSRVALEKRCSCELYTPICIRALLAMQWVQADDAKRISKREWCLTWNKIVSNSNYSSSMYELWCMEVYMYSIIVKLLFLQ